MTFVVSDLLCYYFHFYLHFSVSDIFRIFSLSVVFSSLIIVCFGVILYRVTLLMINWISWIWWKFFGYYFSNIFSALFQFCTRTPVSPMLYHLLYPIVAIILFLYLLHFFLLLYFTLHNYCCLQVLCESSHLSTL